MSNRGTQEQPEEVFNPTRFPPRAVAIFEAVRGVNPTCRRTRRAAERLARADAIYESGFSPALPHGPLYKTLWFGPHAAPMTQMAQAASRALCGGSLPDGSPPLITVQCAEFMGPYPHIVQPLISPTGDPRTGYVRPARLSQQEIERPHLQIKTAAERVPIERWNKAFEKMIKTHFFGPLIQKAAEQEQEMLARFANQELERMELAYAPYNAVVVFEGLEMLSPALLTQVLTPILRTGFLPIEGGEPTDFRNTIVIMTMRDPFDIMRKGQSLGLLHNETELSGNRAQYLKVLKALEESAWGLLLPDLRDQFLLIGDRTKEAQVQLLLQRLMPIVEALKRKRISISFPEEFCKTIIDKSRHPLSQDDEDGGFSDALLDDIIEEFIVRPLACATIEGRLTPESDLRFEFSKTADTDEAQEAEHFDNGVCFRGYYAPTSLNGVHNPPLTRNDIEALFTRPTLEIPDTSFVEELRRREHALLAVALERMQEASRQIQEKMKIAPQQESAAAPEPQEID